MQRRKTATVRRPVENTSHVQQVMVQGTVTYRRPEQSAAKLMLYQESLTRLGT